MSKSPTPSTTDSNVLPTAPASVVDAVTGVSVQVASTVGSGGVTDPLQAVTGTPASLTGADGKPVLFY